ncbi:MAG: helix-turn-helix domain-containing protein, partial [Patescibacteria group bacterium]
RETFPFWVLTLKRIADTTEGSDLPESIKKKVSDYFLDSIQSQDLFLTIDSVRKSLSALSDAGFLPTIFFLRFDRMKDSLSAEFLANLEGLIDASHRKACFVFTSNRPLHELSPDVFNKQAVSVFADTVYIKPANPSDTKIVFEANLKSHPLKLSEEIKNNLLSFVDGYIQYLQFAMISLGEADKIPMSKNELFDFLSKDERIALQSEELWESLNQDEQKVLLKALDEKVEDKELKNADYLTKTGLINDSHKIFSILFEEYVKSKKGQKDTSSLEFTKKELSLLTFLEKNKDQVCEREQIIEAVWPEAEELGVTDWAIDRLVARVRVKLKNQNSGKEIVTVKTRGYKLTE